MLTARTPGETSLITVLTDPPSPQEIAGRYFAAGPTDPTGWRRPDRASQGSPADGLASFAGR